MGSIPVQAWIFFSGLLFPQLLKLSIYCDDLHLLKTIIIIDINIFIITIIIMIMIVIIIIVVVIIIKIININGYLF